MAFEATLAHLDRQIKLNEIFSSNYKQYYLSHHHNGWIGIHNETCKPDCKGWDGISGHKCECGKCRVSYMVSFEDVTECCDEYGHESVKFTPTVGIATMYNMII